MTETRGADWAFDRYETIRPRLPAASFPSAARHADTLEDTFDDFDAYILDGFGVLNVGGTAISGAVERVAAMRAAGKAVVVLTNAATQPPQGAVAKYDGLGFTFTSDDIVSSRDVAVAALGAFPADLTWGVTAAGAASMQGLPIRTVALEDDPAAYEAMDAVLFLSSDAWSDARQARLAEALAVRTRPVVVANPDLVAPREEGLTLEPGHYAHELADAGLCVPQFFGKPFPNAFAAVMQRLGPGAPPRSRIAMVGDTLHTDILGGAAAGWGTILVAEHGLFKGRDVAGYIARSGIVPDVVVRTT